jgi:hypothetical protein
MVHQQDKSKEMDKWEEAHWISPPLKTKFVDTNFTSWKV